MPLMTPAAQKGIHAIWMPHMRRPGTTPKSGDVQEEQHHDALLVVRRVDRALEPVVRRAVAVALHGLGVVRFLHVQEHAAEEHAPDAVELRAVRVLRRLALGVVLAVDRGPLLGDHARGEPQPEAEEVAHDRVQVERPVRLAAVQVERHARDRDLDEHEQGEECRPTRAGRAGRSSAWSCAFRETRSAAGSGRCLAAHFIAPVHAPITNFARAG